MITDLHQQRTIAAMPTDELFWVYRSDRAVAVRNELIMRHIDVARHLAIKLKRSVPKSIAFDDLLSDATIGLMRAIERFDPSHGFEFKTFAGKRILGAMLDGLRRHEWAPRSVRRRGDKPRRMVSMDARFHTRSGAAEDVQSEWIMQFADSAQPDPCEAVIAADRRRSMVRFVNKRRRLMIAMYHFNDFTMKEIGRVIGVTECMVCKEITNGMIQLRARRWRIAAEGE